MVINFLLFCLYGIFACFYGETGANEAIVGGDIAGSEDFSYQVSLLKHGDDHVCGGGVIDALFILTAAHCLMEIDGEFDKEHLLVLAGTHNLSDIHHPAQIVGVKKMYVPRAYKYPFTKSIADIAVLKLNHSLHLSHHIKKLELPKHEDENYEGKTAKIAGWGMDEMIIHNGKEHGTYTDTKLRFGEAKVISNGHCQDGYQSIDINDKNICARVKQRHHLKPHGACYGDSGGPLVYNDVVIGVFSLNSFGCAERIKAGIYTRVSNYLTFIDHAKHDVVNDDIRTYEFHE